MSIENGCDYYFSCKDCECSHCLVVKQRKEIKLLKYKLDISKIAKERLENDNERLYKNNVELQKQVDELKLELQGQFDKGVKAGCLMSKVKEQQTVKYTVKEIEDKIQELLDTPFEGKTEKQEYQRKGMEEGLKMVLEIVRECKGVEVK